MKNSNRSKTLLLVLGVYLGILVVIEGVGEIAIYWKESRRPSGTFGEEILSHEEPLLGFALKKNIKKTIANWTVVTNNYGFRDSQSFTKEKDPGEYRIFIIGGSTVFGWGVNAEQSIPNLIQNLFNLQQTKEIASLDNHRQKKIRIINAGVPWYASWHEAALVFFRILEMNPDQIVILDGLNDTADAMAPSWNLIADGYIDTPTRIAYEKRKARESFSTPFIELMSLSPTFRYFYAKWKNHEELANGSPHPEVWHQYITYMHRIKTLTDSKGIKFDLFFQPVMVVDKPLVYTEVISDATSMKKPEFANKFRDLYLLGEKTVARQKDLPFVSLRQAFKNEKNIMYLDGLHYTAEGNQILAKMIFEKIEKEL